MKRAGLQSCFLVILLAPLAGCASLGPAVTRSNNHVQMPHYSFVIPPDRGWHIQQLDSSAESAIIGQQAGSLRFEMKIMRNVISDDALKQATAKAVADDFRELEKRIMIEQGVDRGLYRLEDVTMSEETLGGLTFYTMSYSIAADSGKQQAALYLWIPRPERNDAFIVAHYSETMPLNTFLVSKLFTDFKSTLQTLALR
jgi:hypothetical protein